MRASGSNSVTFAGVELPREALRGGFPIGDDRAYLQRNLAAGLLHAAASLGVAEAAAQAVRGGGPDAGSVVLAAENAIDLAATRAIVARAATLVDQAEADVMTLFAEAQAAEGVRERGGRAGRRPRSRAVRRRRLRRVEPTGPALPRCSRRSLHASPRREPRVRLPRRAHARPRAPPRVRSPVLQATRGESRSPWPAPFGAGHEPRVARTAGAPCCTPSPPHAEVSLRSRSDKKDHANDRNHDQRRARPCAAPRGGGQEDAQGACRGAEGPDLPGRYRRPPRKVAPGSDSSSCSTAPRR